MKSRISSPTVSVASGQRQWLPIVALQCLALFGALEGIQGASYVFNVGNGAWGVPGNWVQNALPGALDTAFIRGGRTVNLNATGAPVVSPVVENIYIGEASAQSTLNLKDGDTLTVSDQLQVMRRGAATIVSANGNLTMTGGTLIVSTLFVGNGSANAGGQGSLIVSGNSSITGAISVGSAAAANGLGTFSITGSTATIGDGGVGSRALSINASGTLEFSLDATGASALNYNANAVTFGSGAKINVDGSAYTGMGGDIYLVYGNSLSVTPLNVTTSLTGFTDWTPTIVYDIPNGDVILRLTAVPEPSIASLLLAGLGLCLFRRKRMA